MIKKHNKKGFTLIEVLVVVLIIGILAAVALPSYSRAVEKSRTGEAVQVLSTIASGEQRERLAKYKYTNRAEDLDLTYTNFSDGSKVTGSTFNGEFFDYTIFGDDKEAAFAQRNNGEYTLSVDYATKEIFCRPSSHYICQELGVLEGPKMSKYDNSNIQDWVMKDYVMYAIEELSQLWKNGCGKDLSCLTSGELCTDDGEGTCLNAVSQNTRSPSNYIIGADGNKYFWGIHDGKLTFNVNTYGNNPFFFQIFFYDNGIMQMRVGSGSSNPGFNATLAELNEYIGDRHFMAGGWNFYSVPESNQ